ncbi:hypothetical protein GCM10022393_26770 [Aquimarina addita]|uniref:SH3b domain-containing protein n=1 Tax=Aquimarina addita TaxID=870485 RepID=A0ABP6UQK7_9FLAO
MIARSGLTVRSAPDINSKKINVIPFGTEVTVKDKTTVPFEVNDNGYKILGTWFSIQNDSLSTQPSYVFSGFLKTIDEIANSYKGIHTPNKMFDRFHGVYQFNEKVNGIVILDAEEYLNISDIDFNNYISQETETNEDIYYKNTFVTLYKNKKATRAFNHLLNEEFYVYFEKGAQKIKIINILFYPSECAESFVVLELDPFISNSLGKPIMASKINLELTYASFLKEAAHYNYLTDIRKLGADCGFANDNGHIQLFAKYKEYYFGYRNDPDITAIYIEPYRQIIRFDQQEVNIQYSSFLDLFGCPCL